MPPILFREFFLEKIISKIFFNVFPDESRESFSPTHQVNRLLPNPGLVQERRHQSTAQDRLFFNLPKLLFGKQSKLFSIVNGFRFTSNVFFFTYVNFKSFVILMGPA